jgi:formylglycine-generating enzyme required for sulfatase activity
MRPSDHPRSVLALWGLVLLAATAQLPAESAASKSQAESWTNSLGMVFKSVPGVEVRFSIWETRVQDFSTFVEATGYEPDNAMTPPRGRFAETHSWNHPGFEQRPDHPVVWVSWEDAKEFCSWLTKTERASGKLGAGASYRLPTDAEWSQAVGLGIFPWSQVIQPVQPTNGVPHGKVTHPQDERRWLPPPPRAGNYAGEELQSTVEPLVIVLRNYRDDYAHTAPVGSFVPNGYGLFDLGGNVWEWCEDWYHREMLPRELETKVPFVNGDGGGKTFKVLRGASWLDSHPAILRSETRFFEFPDQRSDTIGFRLVITGQKP